MLTVTDLSKRFATRPIFSDVNFSVNAGELLHIAGQNGAGKTTLLKIIVGLLPCTTGTVRSEEAAKSLRGGASEEAAKGLRSGAEKDYAKSYEYLSADHDALFAPLSAWDNLKWWASFKTRVKDEEIIEITKRYGIRMVRELPVAYYSTGMRKRLGLARLSLSPSPLWVLDEPFTGLDSAGVAVFTEVLQNHLRTAGTAIVVSHDTSPIERLTTQRLRLNGK